jgi:hypothetical protein
VTLSSHVLYTSHKFIVLTGERWVVKSGGGERLGSPETRICYNAIKGQ